MKPAAAWLAPCLVCLALYWPGLTAWFQADDFAWLKLARGAGYSEPLAEALFAPKAQGTIRPWSERLYFIVFYNLFGLDALPFRLWAFLTQFANLGLLVWITRRITGSLAAGFWAALFWAVNSTASRVMVWSSAYNQALCAFFLLLALALWLRHSETGARRYYWAQWAVFVAGLGALEVMVVYPALVLACTWFTGQGRWKPAAAMLPLSAAYAVLHRAVAPAPGGVYAMHFDLSMFRTLGTYWAWTVGPAWMETPWRLPFWILPAAVALVTAGLLAFACRRRRTAWFFPAWFVLTIAPVVPLRDHLSEYYPFIAAAGLAMLGGWAMVAGWRPAAIALAGVYLAAVAPSARRAVEWEAQRARRVESLVLGVGTAQRLHPGKVILLDGVDDALFWTAVLDHPFPLVGAAHVYLTPGTERSIQPHPEWGDPADFIAPAQAVRWALDRDLAAVYTAGGPRLRNVTSFYRGLAPANGATPRRVDAANPLMAYLLGNGWHEADPTHRWMARAASLRLGAPRHAGERLYLRGICPSPSARLAVSVDGVRAGEAGIRNGTFELGIALPAGRVGKPDILVSLEVDRAVGPAADGRELALAFGVLEVR